LAANFTGLIPGTFTRGEMLGGAMGVVSHRVRRDRNADALGIHGHLGYGGFSDSDKKGDGTTEAHWEGGLLGGGGFEVRMGRGVKLIGEYFRAIPLGVDESGYQNVSLGVRVHGPRWSLDLGVFFPSNGNSPSIPLPLASLGFRF
jgi:hypothetical protein